MKFITLRIVVNQVVFEFSANAPRAPKDAVTQELTTLLDDVRQSQKLVSDPHLAMMQRFYVEFCERSLAALQNDEPLQSIAFDIPPVITEHSLKMPLRCTILESPKTECEQV
ncbi:hypothetical protein [Neptunomonas marina]|uniref:Uncharacterized protein n=1 Tax=Neptunomonas marina TaxID=1815562 RepID=A0A437QCA0_9GAMM|nr:hypothetical protein [Neptunomonas marina]RVU32157.1 hypothetical protein EOE65_00445 [Neptunomonas marina]